MIKLTQLLEMAKMNRRIRYHMSGKEIPDVMDIRLPITSHKKFRGMKPNGFWYAFGNEWLNFTRNDYTDAYVQNVYHVRVKSRNILQMSSFDELVKFSNEYKMDVYGRNFIDWVVVSKKYDGIEIRPYIHEARFNDATAWYYGWDIACGCVWNSKVELTKVLDADNYEDAYGEMGGAVDHWSNM